MKRILIISAALAMLSSCGDECFTCQGISGYPSSTICKDTYMTTVTEQSPSWADYQTEALNAGCLKQ